MDGAPDKWEMLIDAKGIPKRVTLNGMMVQGAVLADISIRPGAPVALTLQILVKDYNISIEANKV